MSIYNVKLDTTSDYMIAPEEWPNPVCDVMVDSHDLEIMAYKIFDTKPGDAWIDIYAFIDPARRLVTDFLLMCKYEDGNEKQHKFAVLEYADQVEYYKTFENQGGDDFKRFIAESCLEIINRRAEYIGCLIDVVDDFLEKRDVRIPTSDAEFIAQGNELGAQRLCGKDYDDLANEFENSLGISPQKEICDRLKAIQWWSEKYNPDELDFYTDLKSDGFTLEQIEDACGESAAEHVKEFWEEHGLS